MMVLTRPVASLQQSLASLEPPSCRAQEMLLEPRGRATLRLLLRGKSKNSRSSLDPHD